MSVSADAVSTLVTAGQHAVRRHRHPRRARRARRETATRRRRPSRPQRSAARARPAAAGSSSRSASWMATIVPRALRSPRRIALPFPPLRSACEHRDRQARRAAASASTSRVPSVEPSSTTRISRGDGQIDRQQPIDDGADGPGLVVDGNDDREQLGAAAHRRRAGAGCGAPARAGTRASRC